MSVEVHQRFSAATGTRLSAIAGVGALLLVAVLAALPFFASRGLIQDLFLVFSLLALAQYWNLLAGYAGLVSIGQQAFVGLARLYLVRQHDARGARPGAVDPDRRRGRRDHRLAGGPCAFSGSRTHISPLAPGSSRKSFALSWPKSRISAAARAQRCPKASPTTPR